MNELRSPVEEIPRAVSLPVHLPSRWRKPSLIWLVPILTVLAVAGLGLWALAQRGPSITITFASAEGLEPHKTTIKYKGVDIGMVESIELADDSAGGRAGVAVTAQLSRKAAPLLVDDARFWVVRPRVSAAGITGVGTLLTGAHIAFDPGAATARRREFVGLEAPPATPSDQSGRRFLLHAESLGSLGVGSPLYLRSLQVGQVTRVALDRKADGVGLEIFVEAPYDQHVTNNTRFWNASGVDVSLNARGLKVATESLTSVLLGGIALQTPPEDAGPAARAEAEFTLFPGREAALRNLGTRSDGYLLTFRNPIRGLAAGAPVELFGLDVGEVAQVSVDFDGRTAEPRTVVSVSLHPDRLQVRAGEDGAAGQPAGDSRALLGRLVDRGLRAQLRTDNILTGQRYVALDFAAGARPGKLVQVGETTELPTFEGGDDLPAAISQLVAKLDKLPLDEFAREGTLAVREMRRTLEGTAKLVNHFDTEVAPQMAAVLGQARKTLGSVERTLGSDAPVQQDLRTALRDLSNAGQALRSLAEYLERHPESLIRGKKGE